jgi:hypothetical protein
MQTTNFKIWQVVYLLSQKKYSSQPELNNWTKISYKRGKSTQEETEREAKHTQENEHWLNQSFASNRYTALQEEVNFNSRKLVLRTCQNLFHSIRMVGIINCIIWYFDHALFSSMTF